MSGKPTNGAKNALRPYANVTQVPQMGIPIVRLWRRRRRVRAARTHPVPAQRLMYDFEVGSSSPACRPRWVSTNGPAHGSGPADLYGTRVII